MLQLRGRLLFVRKARFATETVCGRSPLLLSQQTIYLRRTKDSHNHTATRYRSCNHRVTLRTSLHEQLEQQGSLR